MRRLSRKTLLVFGIYAILIGLALATRQRLQGRKQTP